MHITVRHKLQVFDPADSSLCESGAVVLPVAEAEAVMGETVAAYLARVAWRFELPTVCRINGEFYARAEWETRALGLNDNVEFLSRPLGGGSSGGSSGKSILSIVAMVALTAVAGPLGGMVAGAAGGGFFGAAAGALAQAAIVGAGALAVSHFLKPKSGGKTNSTDALYSFGLQGNAARPMQPIPVLNGRLRFAPDYAAPTYSEYAGDAMTDYALYALTCGRMRVEQVLIGDTPIWDSQAGYSPDYPGIELQFVEPGEQVTLYPVNVVTADEMSGAELQQTFTPGYIINAASTQAKELIFDFVWPGGAYVTFKDRTLAADTHIEIQARTVDDAGAPTGAWAGVFNKVYKQAKQSQIRVTERVAVAPGRYEVRGRRVNPSVNDSGIAKIGGTDDVTWTAARAHIDGPQSFPRVTTLAVKGVASKQLSGVSGGQLRVIGTRILPVWRDGQFVEEPTRSIAWAALDWWRNSDYAAGLSISDIDFQSFVRHAALWDALGHTFDHRFTEVQNLDDVLETVLKAGRAFPAPVGDKLTITRDEPRVLPRMLFTDNDIVRDTLEIDYALSDEAWADGMVGEYVDETTWRLAEVSSAPDGVTLLKPARVQLEGVVNRKQAAGMVRMMAAESQYRRITVSWTARMEGRLLKRGDLVRITTEEPETWGQSCEVTGFRSADRLLTLDPAPEWEAGANHYVEIRRRDGSPWGPVQVSRGNGDAEAIVSVAEFGEVTLADAVGRSDTQERPWLAFSPGQPRSFPVLITDGDPDQDGEHIHLSGVMDAAEVYATTEDGVPPLLQIPDLFSSALPVIAALMAQINQRQAALILTAGWQPAKNAISYEAQVSYDAGVTWIGAYEGDRTTFEAVVGGSDQMKVRVRGVTPAGPRGAWSVVDVAAPSLLIGGDLLDLTGIPPLPYDQWDAEAKARIEAAQKAVDALAAEAKIRIDAVTDALTVDRSEIPALIAQMNEVIHRQLGDLYQSVALAGTSMSANFDEAGRAVAETSSRLLVFQGEATAQFASVTRAVASANEAIVSTRTLLLAEVGKAVASIASEAEARATADSAMTTRVDGAVSRIDSAEASIISLSKTVADNQSATSTQFNQVGARFGTLEGRVGGTEASISSLNTAYANADTALGQRIDTLTGRVGNNEAAITSVSQTQASQAAAQASINTDLSARTDAGTASGRIAFDAVSAPSGVSVRYAIQLSSERGGTKRNAGLFFDLLSDGSSRLVIDTNLFALTANGGITYPFQFDGQFTTITDLRVTQQAILPGSVTDPYVLAVENVDPGASSDDWREIPGTGITVTPDGVWSVVFSGTAVASVTAVGSASVYLAASLQIALGLDGKVYGAGAFCAASGGSGAGAAPIPNTITTGITFSPAALEFLQASVPRRIALLYRFKADPGGSGKIVYGQMKALVSKR